VQCSLWYVAPNKLPVDGLVTKELWFSSLPSLLMMLGQRHINGVLCFELLYRHYASDQIKKNEMGGPCGTYGEQEGA
jgi:hypothetical protein